MPGGWRGLHIDRIHAHGDEFSLSARRGATRAIVDGRQLRRVS
jgi:hypothetical protein